MSAKVTGVPFNYFKYSGTPWSITGHKSQAVLINNVHVFKCFLNEETFDRSSSF